MNEIPEDVIKAATDFQDMVDRDPKAYTTFDVAVLAILEEREACAKIAEGNAKGFDFQRALADGDDIEVGAKSVQLAISDAIRRR